MTIPIRPAPAVPPIVSPLERGATVGAPSGPSFADLLRKGIGEVQTMQDGSGELLQRFLRGEPVELHQVMAASEEAGIALDLLVEMRNKLTEAYRSVMNIQF